MEEDLNENEQEERFYSRRYYADETQTNVSTNPKDVEHIVTKPPQKPIRRYWHTSADHVVQKINPMKESDLHTSKPQAIEESKVKEVKKAPSPTLSADLSIFQSPVPQFVKKSIEIVENETPCNIVELESSDEDEVIEVKLPPKPTITIESSDDEEVSEVSQITDSKSKTTNIVVLENRAPSKRGEREVSASPVPSIVSSVSDEFIRGDCIALNISSKRPNNQCFDFSLHGSDIIDQSTPPKKKKKKKNKEAVTSTPITNTPVTATPTAKDGEYFATPKSKARKKRQKTKNYSVSEKSIPSADVYDSDSNLSMNDADKTHRSYSVTDRSFPSADVYESDSNQSEKTSPSKINEMGTEPDVCTTSDSSICLEPIDNHKQAPKATEDSSTNDNSFLTVDLTETSFTNTIIDENIIMANVTGFREPEVIGDSDNVQADATKFGSTNVPAILYEDLDFDNLKGKEKVCKKRRYSLSTLRAEMEKFYNESWGGENFNHREIQKNMSRDKSLWVIDPKDRMPGLSRRKPTCNYCNRPGHRDDTCRVKPPVCYMCGLTGHYEPRCPRKICVNCGSPNHMYTTMCRNCSNWNNIRCAECGQIGHPSSHCPDVWRRYHNTITCNTPLEENRQTKKYCQMFCSGCARRGHLIHTCRVSLPFSGLPINSPYVSIYNPFYVTTNENSSSSENANSQRNRNPARTNTQDETISSATLPNRNERNKRQSNSPVCHEGHANKKRNISNSDELDMRQNTKSPNNVSGRKTPQCKNQSEDANKAKETSKTIIDDTESPKTTNGVTEKAPDFIPLSSTNHDKKGQIIQDNEVSDTSDVVTSARIYFTNDISEKLKTKDGEELLKELTLKNNVTIQNTDFNLFLNILGKVGDQESFHAELRKWIKSQENSDNVQPSKDLEQNETEKVEADSSNNIPRNRYNLLRKINRALESLKEDLGDPKDIYKELTYLQNHHQQLLKQKEISPKQLSNNRDNIKGMLRKLNMVLVGQAGLANGSKHLNELYALQEKLTNYRQKYIPPQMRREIGEHYHCIFTALPREDYQELLSKYYTSKPKPVLFKKKKNDKSPMHSPVANAKKKFAKNSQRKKKELEEFGGIKVGGKNTNARKPLVEQTMNKLVFYHRRLMRTKPHDKNLNKTKFRLVNQLNSHISSLGQNVNLSSKSLKKMRKRMKVTQEQAQLFLTNV
ncbi:uncharacterized protein Zcchc7 [Battus philenor]|uniref:uncharacterized protein Zcchc7 n=1 Tax=Battus philenor TaxID=42288 RepID=UPI0035CEE069